MAETTMPMQSDEPGAYDNRLSLDPNDDRWPFVLDWEDGEEYTVTLRIRQISPGEFEVLSASTKEGGSETREEYGETKKIQKPREEKSVKKPGGKGQPIPAILAVIGKNQ
jgi:hypothetical protein